MYNRCEVIKILGVHFSYDPNQKDVLNFRQTLKTIKKAINLWKWRGLSLLGRIHKFYCSQVNVPRICNFSFY